MNQSPESIQHLSKRSNSLLLILTVFFCTFFIYRDFGIRMLAGYTVMGLIFMWHLFHRIRQNVPVHTGCVKWILVALNVALLVQFIRPASSHNADTVSFMLSMLFCTALVVMAVPDENEIRRVLNFVLAASLLVAVYIFLFELFPDLFWNSVYHVLSPTAQEYLTYYVPKGYGFSLGGCSYTNYVLFFGVAVCCSFFIKGRLSGKQRNVLIASMLILFLAMVVVGRRGELLGALLCCVLLMLTQCNRRQRRILIIWGIVLLIVGTCLFLLLMPVLRDVSFLARYVITVESILSGSDFTSGRGALYGIALQGFFSNPIFGVGWDQYVTLVPDSMVTSEGTVIADAHNIYLQMLCESGIVGTILVLFPMLYLFWHTGYQVRRLKTKDLPVASQLSSLSFMIQSFLLLVGMFDPTFQKVFFWGFYGIAIVCLVAAMEREGYTPQDAFGRGVVAVMTPVERLCRKLVNRMIVREKDGSDQ